MIHEEIEHNIVPRRYVGASNRLPNIVDPPRAMGPSIAAAPEKTDKP